MTQGGYNVRETFSGWSHDVRLRLWQVAMLPRIVSYRLNAPQAVSKLAGQLRQEGIAIGSAADVFSQGEDGPFAQVTEAAQRARDEAVAKVREGGTTSAEQFVANPHKDYRVHLLPRALAPDHPVLQLALDPRLLELVNGYLGMWASLRALDVWWDRPTEDLPKETQLWHRDHDDRMNVKVFVYLNDVGVDGGPFCFIPGTHPRGAKRLLRPACDHDGRTTDEQMARAVPESSWRVCTGARGTVVLCDTCGYHKGLKPKGQDRLMMMLQFTSGAPQRKPAFTLHERPHGELRPSQRWALSEVLAEHRDA